MLSKVFNLFKVAAVIFYLVVLASLVVESWADYRLILLSIAAVLLVAHVVEFCVVKHKLANVSRRGAIHFLNVLLFGFLYWIPLLYSGNNHKS